MYYLCNKPLSSIENYLFTVVAVLTHCLSAQRLCFLAASSSSLTSRYRGSSLSARTRRRRKGACFSSKDWSVLLKSSIEGHSSGETSVHKSSRNAAISIARILRDSLYTAGSGGTATHNSQTTKKRSEAIDYVTEVEYYTLSSGLNITQSREWPRSCVGLYTAWEKWNMSRLFNSLAVKGFFGESKWTCMSPRMITFAREALTEV